jgi:hypothetical protein
LFCSVIALALALAVANDKEWHINRRMSRNNSQHPSTCRKGVGYTFCLVEAEDVQGDIVNGTGKIIMLR